MFVFTIIYLIILYMQCSIIYSASTYTKVVCMYYKKKTNCKTFKHLVVIGRLFMESLMRFTTVKKYQNLFNTDISNI